MERFVCETMIVSGEGALEALAEQPGKRLLAVTDGMQTAGNPIPRIRDMIRPVAVAGFDRMTPEPTVAQTVEGANLIKEFCPELVVALGCDP